MSAVRVARPTSVAAVLSVLLNMEDEAVLRVTKRELAQLTGLSERGVTNALTELRQRRVLRVSTVASGPAWARTRRRLNRELGAELLERVMVQLLDE